MCWLCWLCRLCWLCWLGWLCWLFCLGWLRMAAGLLSWASRSAREGSRNVCCHIVVRLSQCAPSFAHARCILVSGGGSGLMIRSHSGSSRLSVTVCIGVRKDKVPIMSGHGDGGHEFRTDAEAKWFGPYSDSVDGGWWKCVTWHWVPRAPPEQAGPTYSSVVPPPLAAPPWASASSGPSADAWAPQLSACSTTMEPAAPQPSAPQPSAFSHGVARTPTPPREWANGFWRTMEGHVACKRANCGRCSWSGEPDAYCCRGCESPNPETGVVEHGPVCDKRKQKRVGPEYQKKQRKKRKTQVN